jgi:hypothetical protein
MKRVVILTVIGLFAPTAVTVRAQTPAPKAPAEKGVTVATTPERVIADLEGFAKRRQEEVGTPAPRGYSFRIGLPDSAAEFAALGGYAPMLLTVLSQKPEELPVKRVYIQSGGQEAVLQELSSWLSDVDSKLLAFKIYGPYREDGFYLVPIGPLAREGVVLADFAPTGISFAPTVVVVRLVQLPSNSVVQRAYAKPDPAPGAKPDPRALKAIIGRKFPGFPMPKYP